MAEIYSVNINTKDAVKSIANLEKELQECNEKLKDVEIGSDAFKELQKRAAAAKGQIDNFNRTTDMLSKGMQGWGEAVGKTVTGMTSGITAATALMQMFGSENENVIKGIAYLQQLMAFTQAISGLKDLVEGFKMLKGAILAVTGSSGPLGLALLALGAIATAWLTIKNNTEEAGDAAIDYKEKIKDVNEFIAKENRAEIISNLPKEVADKYKKATEDITKYGQAYQDIMDTLDNTIMDDEKRKNLKDTALRYKELADNAMQYMRDVLAAYPAYIKGEIAASAEQAKRSADILKETAKETADYLNPFKEDKKKTTTIGNAPELPESEEEVVDTSKEDEYLSKLKKRYEEITSTISAFRKQEKSTYEEDLKVLDTFLNTKLISEEEYYKQKAALQEYYASEEARIEQEKQQKIAESLQKATGVVQDSMSRYAESTDGIDSKWINVAQDVQDAFNSAAESISKNGEITADAAAKMAAAAIQGIGTILNNIASEQDTNNKEGFEKSKKLQIAASTMNMIGGIVAALAGTYTTHTGWWDWVLAGVQASTIAALGGVQIAKISKMTYEGNNASSGSSGLNTGAMTSTLVAPTQYSSAVEGASIESAVTDSRVYVVESDINQTGSRVNVQENENRY